MSSFKNVLIVLGAMPRIDGRPSDAMVSRVRKAISLYKKENYSKVILSGGPSRGIPEAEMMRVMMLRVIPQEKLLVEPHSRTTSQNAVLCWALIKDNKPKKITVVTSNYHLSRASYIFRKLYAHMSISLKFEGAQDNFDPLESIFFKIKELVLFGWVLVRGFG